MEIFLVALSLLALIGIVANYVNTTIALILTPFFIYIVWNWESISV